MLSKKRSEKRHPTPARLRLVTVQQKRKDAAHKPIDTEESTRIKTTT
jgi:hypothetical protein